MRNFTDLEDVQQERVIAVYVNAHAETNHAEMARRFAADPELSQRALVYFDGDFIPGVVRDGLVGANMIIEGTPTHLPKRGTEGRDNAVKEFLSQLMATYGISQDELTEMLSVPEAAEILDRTSTGGISGEEIPDPSYQAEALNALRALAGQQADADPAPRLSGGAGSPGLGGGAVDIKR